MGRAGKRVLQATGEAAAMARNENLPGDAPLISRARAIAAAYPGPCAVSGKHGKDCLAFGAPRNLGKPLVLIPTAEFAAMTDEEVLERLHSAWNDAAAPDEEGNSGTSDRGSVRSNLRTPRAARKGRPKSTRPPGRRFTQSPKPLSPSADDLRDITHAAGLPLGIDESRLRDCAWWINRAAQDFVVARDMDRYREPPHLCAEWADGVADACRRLLLAFGNGDPNYHHRAHSHLKRGMPDDVGASKKEFLTIRLLLMRGFGPDWRNHLNASQDPDVFDLLYLGMPRFIEFAQALGLLAERASAAWRAETQPRGGSKADIVRTSLMARLVATFRDMFGRLPSISYARREEVDPKREAVPGGRDWEWFAMLLQRLEGTQPTRDALAHWIENGKDHLAAQEAAREPTADNPD